MYIYVYRIYNCQKSALFGFLRLSVVFLLSSATPAIDRRLRSQLAAASWCSVPWLLFAFSTKWQEYRKKKQI